MLTTVPPAATLEEVIAAEVARPVSSHAVAMAERIRQGLSVPEGCRGGGCRGGGGVAAVLFYGSCLRDGVEEGRLLDLYVLTDGYRSVHRNLIARVGNAVLPPNVYYAEEVIGGRTVRAKVATVSLSALERRVDAFEAYFWARFCQPCALVWVRDEECRKRIVTALAGAVATMVTQARPLVASSSPAALWTTAFAETYGSELRSERGGRGAELYAADAPRYDLVARMVATGRTDGGRSRRAASWRWCARRIVGKTFSVLRLLKAAFTFQNGALYLMWKIRRHAQVELTLSPWQQRHPVLAASVLFWRLYRKGAFR